MFFDLYIFTITYTYLLMYKINVISKNIFYKLNGAAVRNGELKDAFLTSVIIATIVPFPLDTYTQIL